MAHLHDRETLADLLNDSMIRAVMRADHVDKAKLEASLIAVGARLGRRAGVVRMTGERYGAAKAMSFPAAILAGLGCADVCQNHVGW